MSDRVDSPRCRPSVSGSNAADSPRGPHRVVATAVRYSKIRRPDQGTETVSISCDWPQGEGQDGQPMDVGGSSARRAPLARVLRRVLWAVLTGGITLVAT